MSASDNERLAREFVGSWNDHDADKTVALVADNGIWVDVAQPEPMRDKAAMRAYVQNWYTGFPDISGRIVNMVATEDQVAGEIEFSGTNSGSLQMGAGGPMLPPTGKAFNGKGTFFARVSNGKVSELHTYPDMAGVMMQLGLAPMP